MMNFEMFDATTPQAMLAARKKLGCTQAALAERLGVTKTSIGMMERGEAKIARRTALAIQYLQYQSVGYSVEFHGGRPSVICRPR